MSGPAQAYAKATSLVVAAISQVDTGNDKERAAYLIARAALLHVRGGPGGTKRASEMAYALADELATAGDQ